MMRKTKMKKKKKQNKVIWLGFCLGLSILSWGETASAQELQLEDDVLIVRIPDPPEVEALKTLKDLDKAIELKLEESFIIKITESMKKNPF